MSKIAYNVIPDRFDDNRHGAIMRGFERHGYTIKQGWHQPRNDDDILLTWTVHKGRKEQWRNDFENFGCRVLVCEESYIKNPLGMKHIALSWHDHNGAGQIPTGDGSRWAAWNIELKQWRIDAASNHILIREQRGIGSLIQGCPSNFHNDAAAILRRMTKRDVIIRLHPKHDPDKTPDNIRLKNCHALIVWNSSMASTALIAGVPVIAMGSHCMVMDACHRSLNDIEDLKLFRRVPIFERQAWGQWSLNELESGVAADHLLSIER